MSDHSDPTPEHLAAAQVKLLKGSGWRVGLQPQRYPYSALVGGDDWAFELTMAEWQDFWTGLITLQADLARIRSQLMSEESVVLEHQTAKITLTAIGKGQIFSLYLQLHSGRSSEGSWTESAVPGLITAVTKLQES